MGAKKLKNYSLIDDKKVRVQTYTKRKRGLIKKAMELSKLCGVQIFLTIHDDKKSNLVVYNTDEQFGPQ